MKKYILIICLLSAVIYGCDNDLIEITDPARTPFEESLETEESLILLSNGMYQAMGNSPHVYNQWGNWLMVLDARTDDAFITANGTGFNGMGALSQYTNISSESIPERLWRNHYLSIRRANQVIEVVGADENPDITQALKNRLIGEAYFVRGFNYYSLARAFGDAIPLITENASNFEEMLAPPAGEGELWAQVESDLRQAESLLPNREDYTEETDLGRATKGAAVGMLGKAYLYQLRYAEALAEFEKVINQQVGSYVLLDNFRHNFTEGFDNNAESLFEFQTASLGRGARFNALAQSGGPGRWYNIAPTQAIIDVFLDNPGDPRYHMTFYAPDGANYTASNGSINNFATEGTLTYRKYDIDVGYFRQARWGVNLNFLRYADVLLSAAECAIATGDDAKAKGYISQVRARANNIVDEQPQLYYSTDYVGAMPTGFPIETDIDAWMAEKGWTLLEVLINERRMEMTFEQSRYFDLQRWHRAGWLDINDFITEAAFEMGKNEIFPIPERELSANPAMVGNSAN